MKEDSSSFDDILNEADEEETETVETPAVEAATEAPAVEESVEEVTQPSAPDGFTQDARGVWHRPDGTIAAKEEVAKFGAAKPAGATVAGDAVATGAPGADLPAAVPTPFSFKSQGQDFPLDGATLDKDGNLVVSKSNLATVQQMFREGHGVPDRAGQRGAGQSRVDPIKDTDQRVVGQGRAGRVRVPASGRDLGQPGEAHSFPY